MALFQNVLQKNDRAVSRAHSDLIAVVVQQGNHSVSHVNKILSPGLTHKFQHFENLFEMEILLIRHHVKALIEVVMLFAVTSRGEISRCVKRSAVRP